MSIWAEFLHCSPETITTLIMDYTMYSPTACNVGDLGSSPDSGRSPGEGNGNPLQFSCLENSMERGSWRATVHGVTKSQIWLSDSHTHTHTHIHQYKIKSLKNNKKIKCPYDNFQVLLEPRNLLSRYWHFPWHSTRLIGMFLSPMLANLSITKLIRIKN